MENRCKSEVAWRLEQITLEYEAAQRGLSGFAQGTARHEFITAKMERIGQIHEELGILVGPEQAIRLVFETLEMQISAGNNEGTGTASTAGEELRVQSGNTVEAKTKQVV